jgi:hypothetical protein
MIFLIIGVVGKIGSGKSFTQLKQGLQYADEREKQIVTNFPLNLKALEIYARSPKILDFPFGDKIYELKKLYKILTFNIHLVINQLLGKKAPRLNLESKPRLPWILKLLREGGISQIYNPEHIEALMIPDSVVLLDEAGILLNSREFANTSKKLLADLAQSRKDGIDLFWCAQFDEQVDRQFRELTQYFIHCASLSKYDKKMKRPKLFWKQIHWFDSQEYRRWLQDPKARGNYLKTKFAYSLQSEEGSLSESDVLLFDIFDSFARLDSASNFYQINSRSRINTMLQSRLPRDYYRRLLVPYFSFDDPFSRDYMYEFGWWRKEKSIEQASIFSHPVSINSDTKAKLIRQALGIARKKSLKAPMFKNMESEAIQAWIVRYG